MARVLFHTRVYNDEKYIRRCIESVRNQTVTDWIYDIEDNGCTDASREICKEYAEKDDRIYLTRYEENSQAIERSMVKFGRLLSRMKEQDIDYLCWLDSDDWYDSDFLENMLLIAAKGAYDFVVCASRHIDENGNIVTIGTSIDYLQDGDKYISPDMLEQLMISLYPTWGKLFSEKAVQYLKDNVKNQPEEIKKIYALDAYAMKNIFIKEDIKVACTSKILHNYLVKKKSMSHGQPMLGKSEVIGRVLLINQHLEVASNVSEITEKMKKEMGLQLLRCVRQWIQEMNGDEKWTPQKKEEVYQCIVDTVKEKNDFYVFDEKLIAQLIYRETKNKKYFSVIGAWKYFYRIKSVPIKVAIVKMLHRIKGEKE